MVADIVGDGVSDGGVDGVVPDRVEGPGDRVEDLFRRHVPEATTLAFLITRDAHLAEDIAQEAFVRAVGRFRHLRRAEAFDAYLRRAVVNRCRSHFRHQRVARTYLRGAARAGVEVEAGPDLGRRDELRSALEALPDRQRTAVVLRYYADLSEAQAADTLRTSPAAVRSLVARAMETLRERIPRGEDP
jgi:RNA polymerase sigma factor (sigma-70 family)